MLFFCVAQNFLLEEFDFCSNPNFYFLKESTIFISDFGWGLRCSISADYSEDISFPINSTVASTHRPCQISTIEIQRGKSDRANEFFFFWPEKTTSCPLSDFYTRNPTDLFFSLVFRQIYILSTSEPIFDIFWQKICVWTIIRGP